MDMVYRKASDDFRAETNIRDMNPYFLSRFLPVPDVLAGQDLFLNADIEMAADTNLVPSFVNLAAYIPSGSVSVPEEFDAPIALKDITVNAEYKSGEDMVNVSNLSGEIGGIAFKGEARGTFYRYIHEPADPD